MPEAVRGSPSRVAAYFRKHNSCPSRVAAYFRKLNSCGGEVFRRGLHMPGRALSRSVNRVLVVFVFT